jgi:hypothetical protein
MKDTRFIELLEQLEDSSWQALREGRDICIIDDQRLEIGPEESGNAVVSASLIQTGDAEEFRREVISRAPEFLCRYYQAHPLSLAGFKQQVLQLFTEHGAEAFAAAEGELPERTLFVDGSEVIAESAESPRHRYGAYCELDELSPGQDVAEFVMQWLEQGEAHERYLEMNVCRYNC